jgi:hypothetical protein
MTLGVEVIPRDAPPARGAPTDTGAWYVGAYTTSGDQGAPIPVSSLGEFESVVAGRSGQNTALYDALDFYFREGGKKAYISRAASQDAAGLNDALAVFGPQLGPGQVSAINVDPDADVYSALFTHAAENNRVVVADVTSAPASGITDYEALADAVPPNDASYGALFGPWAVGPGPAGVSGVTSRQVPASPVIAALCARVDEAGNPNRAAAGRDYPLRYVEDLAETFSLTDIDTLLNNGVNSMADIYGVLENYGFQTTLAQSDQTPFWQFNCSRMRMALVAQAKALGENYMFKPLDGRGLVEGALKTDIDAMLLGYYNVGALYGTTPEEAFQVDVTSAINTPDTIAQGELHAVASVKLSLHAKSIVIELVSVPVTGAV